MMKKEWTIKGVQCKPSCLKSMFVVRCRRIGVLPVLVAVTVGLAACSINPATGDRQFAALMPAGQEASIGATEHKNVIAQYGEPLTQEPLSQYVQEIGNKLAVHTERSDVTYKFHLLDTPTVNAFALPGGYVYITRGILAAANSESEVAAVLAHEIAHITARHSAERYSRGVLTSLGTSVLGAALDSPQLGNLANVGGDLYIKSYSRGQESQADELGIRYLSRAGYDTDGMTRFLEVMGMNDDIQNRLAGRTSTNSVNYFSTHPRTSDRVAQAHTVSGQYGRTEGIVNKDGYLRRIDGMVYGDSAKAGFTRGQTFYHPQMGFTFTVPTGFTVSNQPTQIVATNNQGAALIFDAVPNSARQTPQAYIAQTWLKGQGTAPVETTTVNGMAAATTAFQGTINNAPVTVRIMAIEWSPDRFFRFQIAMPQNATTALVDELKRSTYSLRPMTAQEKQTVKPYKLQVVTASAGDSVASLAGRMVYKDLPVERFRALNALKAQDNVVPGQMYKIVVE